VEAVLAGLVDRVTRRMRSARRPGRTVMLRLRFGDYTRATRSHSLARATTHTRTILDTARGLLAAARPMIDQRGLTLVGVAVGNLDNDAHQQLELPLHGHDGEGLDRAVDAVRNRFGSASVTRGVLVGRELSPSVPMLSD
jgi:DNA polymerase-4